MLSQHSVLTCVRAGDTRIACLLGVFSANFECCELIDSLLPAPAGMPCALGCGNVPTQWFCRAPGVSQFFMLNFLAWKYYLRIVYVWISDCTGCEVWFLTGNPLPPPLTTAIQCPGKKKKLPCGFSKLVEVLLPAPLLSNGPRPCLLNLWSA